jgi:HlyD family secretion protein
MSRGGKAVISLLAAATIVLIGVGAFYNRKDSGLPRVTVETARVADLVSRVNCNGKIQPKKKIDLSATMSGQIINLAVREGDRVKKGDFLLQIDRTTLQAEADSRNAALQALIADRNAAEANAERARVEFERAKSSFDSGIISDMEFTSRRTDYEAEWARYEAILRRIDEARASFVGARDTLEKTTITSPMSGIITRLQVEEGEVAIVGTMNNPGTALMTISDLSVIEAEMEVDETEIPAVSLGQEAGLTIDAYPGRSFAAMVTEIGSSPIVVPTATGPATSTGVDFLVKLRVDDPPKGIRPGLSCTAEIITGSAEQVVAIPIQALVLREKEGGRRGEEEEGVFLLRDEQARFAPVVTGITGELDIQILEGVSAGDTIITGPFGTLRTLADGDRVLLEEREPG